MARTLRPLEVFPITTRTLEVLRVEDVTSGMRRIVLGGEELAAHTAANGYPVAAFRSDGFDDHCKISLQHPDADEVVGPTQADGVLNWPKGDPHAITRTYTIRRWDPEAGEVDVDFVKHGVGPATSWAYRARPGDRLQIAGPKSSATHPEGADWVLVAGDETALPAIDRWLQEWPEGIPAQVFIEVAENEHRQELRVPDGVRVTWLSRNGAEAGTTTLMADALEAAEWWEGTAFAWVAGETLSLAPIRRWLRTEKGLPKEQVEVTGYWRRQEVVLADDGSGVQDLEATENEGEVFHELSELLPPFALRVAAGIDLAGAFDFGERTLDELVRATGADRTGLGKLLRYLEAIDIVERADDRRYRLTGVGRFLENEHTAEHLDPDRLPAQEELGAALSLLAAVRTGRGDHERWFEAPFAERVRGDDGLLEQRIRADADGALYSAGALAAATPFASPAEITICGRGAGAFASALVDAHPSLHVAVLAAPSEIEVLRRVHGTIERVAYVPGSPLAAAEGTADAALFTSILSSYSDADAVHALRTAAGRLAAGGRVLVFDEVLDPELASEHDYEHDLVDFALHGGGARTHEEHLSLFAAAGLRAPERTTIGWGMTLYSMAEA